MRQCPDCEEKDRVVIAGKIFCANCGTPWQPTDSNEEVAYKQKVGLGGSVSSPSADGSVAQTNTSDTVATSAPTDPQSVVQVPQPESATTLIPPTPVAPSPTPPQVLPESATLPAVLETSMPAPQTSSVVSATTAIPTPPVSVSAPVAPAPTPPPSPSVPAPPAPAIAPVAPVSPPASSTVQAPTISSSSTAEPQSRIGAEIHSLDSKDESVLSDAQIKEMAAITSPPPTPNPPPAPVMAPTPPPAPSAPQPPVVASPATNGRVLNDIVAPSASSTVAPAIVEAIPSQPSSISSPPTNSPSATTTVAGVTMSREDALKLALGDSAVSEVAQKSGPARPTAVVMTVVGLALLGVFLWQVNANDINVKIASLRSGLSASVPGFVPGGWGKAQSLKSGDGNVSYELEKDGKTLKIEQQKSDWDSQAVLEQYVLKHATDYLALQSQGLTIYVFGNNQAAWVNQGTLYTLSGDHGIDQDDIIRMATSL
jgi:hypothetical protein